MQTSNSLYIVRPATGANAADDVMPSQGIRAIASCGVTLEVSKSKESAFPYLRNALPLYMSRDLNTAAAAKASFDAICSNIPLSDGEVQAAWVDMCAFEEQGSSFRPSANILLELWTAILTAATADKINLTSVFVAEDLWISIRDEDYPRGLFDAIMQRIEDPEFMDVDAGPKCKCLSLFSIHSSC